MELVPKPENINKINLTLSARICDNSEDTVAQLIDLQTEALRILPNAGRVWIYPKDRLHFSILNFCTFDSSSFDEDRRILNKTDWFPWLLSYVKESILPKFPAETPFEIRRFYSNFPLKNSLALNVFPESNTFVNQMKIFASDATEYLNSIKMPVSGFGIKCHEDSYFAINILRFFGPEITINDKLHEFVNEKNASLFAEPVKFVLSKPVLVVSDPYLYNDNPVLLTK